MAYKVFDSGDMPITEGDVNLYLMNQAMIACDDLSEPTGIEGMHIYNTDRDEHSYYHNFEWVHYGAKYIRKTASESVTSSTTLQDDNHLKFMPRPFSIYDVKFHVRYFANTSADIKVGVNIPEYANYLFAAHGTVPSATADTALRTSTYDWGYASGLTASFGGLGFDATFILEGTLYVEDTVNEFGLTWAQNTSNVNATTIRGLGTYMRVEYISSNT